jgi:hypothetical protein
VVKEQNLQHVANKPYKTVGVDMRDPSSLRLEEGKDKALPPPTQ